MANYIEYPIGADPDVLLAEFVSDLQTYYPNWVPAEGALGYRAPAVLIGQIAELREVASQVPDEIVKVFGTQLFNVPTDDAQHASVLTDWRARDDAGYGPVPIGTVISIDDVLFTTDDEITFLSGGDLIVEGVSVTAIDEGTAANNLGGTDAAATLEEAYDFITDVTTQSVTSGGVDEEDAATYQNRLVTKLTLLSPKAITTRDLAQLAQTVTGVDRALAIKGYNPDDESYDNEGFAAIALINAIGQPVTTPTKDEVISLVVGPGERLTNVTVNVIDPTYWYVDINYEATTYPNAVASEVEAAADGSIAAALDPALFGQPSGDVKEWAPKTVISLYDIAAAIDNTEGLDQVVSLEIRIRNIDGVTIVRAYDDSDATLGGVAPLPLAGVIEGTVS
jgi:uncharacterized phage protein gp47/JayE